MNKSSSLIKEATVKRLIEAFQNIETQKQFLEFAKYKDAKKFVRTDMGAGNVADNGQHLLEIMSEALKSTPVPALHDKWKELRTANKDYRKKQRSLRKSSKKR